MSLPKKQNTKKIKVYEKEPPDNFGSTRDADIIARIILRINRKVKFFQQDNIYFQILSWFVRNIFS